MMTTGLDPFPPAERVFYRNAPLLQVTCELRFPAILKIEGQSPVDFQERIRSNFPLLERANVPLLPMLPPEFREAMGLQAGGNNWVFSTEDRSQSISLSTQSLSLTVTNYDRWESFLLSLIPIIEAMLEIYKPAYFARTGLRYQDLILRSVLGLGETPWSALLRHEVLGELSLPQFEENVTEVRRAIRLHVPSFGGAVLLQHGFGKKPNQDEPGYMIDFDFYTDLKTEVQDVRPVLEQLHAGVGKAFRWCISDKLHQALDPVALVGSGTNG